PIPLCQMAEAGDRGHKSADRHGPFPSARSDRHRRSWSVMRDPMTPFRWFAGIAACLALASFSARAAEPIATGSVSGLPVPRFVSLKSDRVTVRAGPAKDQDVRWIFTRAA